MTAAIWVLSLLLVAEFMMAPINLWSGRTLPAFTTFTGFAPAVAQRIFAPVKLAGGLLVAVGLAVRPAGIAGAATVSAVCAVYLIRLAAPSRRNTVPPTSAPTAVQDAGVWLTIQRMP